MADISWKDIRSVKDNGSNTDVNNNEGSVPVEKTAKDYSEFKLDLMDITPIVIDEIRDTGGRLKDAVSAIEIDTGCSVIPLEHFGLSPKIVSIQEHEIVHLRSIKYCMSNKVRQTVVTDFCERIKDKVSNGLVFEESLWGSIGSGADRFSTLVLNFKEMAYIVSSFINCDAKILRNSDDDFVLLVK